jgi:hypothetical protein
MADDKVSLCRLWKKEGNYGDYFVGRMGGARVLVYQNLRKADDRDHDAEVFVVNAPQGNSSPPAPKAKPDRTATRQQSTRPKPETVKSVKESQRAHDQARKFQAPTGKMPIPGPAPGEPIIDDIEDDLDAVFDRMMQDRDPAA